MDVKRHKINCETKIHNNHIERSIQTSISQRENATIVKKAGEHLENLDQESMSTDSSSQTCLIYAENTHETSRIMHNDPLGFSKKVPATERNKQTKNAANGISLENNDRCSGTVPQCNDITVQSDISLPNQSVTRPTSLLSRPGNYTRKQSSSRLKRHASRTNLYIRGLPKSMSENDLVSLVPDAQAIRSVKLVINNDGEGYGFIDFVSNESAAMAMQHIKSKKAHQYVNFAYESEKDPLNVYVTNIPESWNSNDVEKLKSIFSPYGVITSALVMTRRSTNTCTGTGFVRYLNAQDAQNAIDGIRKAKITLAGANRPLELKLADRQRFRDSKSESSSEKGVMPLLQKMLCDEMQLNCLQNSPIALPINDIYHDCASQLYVGHGVPTLEQTHPISVIPIPISNDSHDQQSFANLVTCVAPPLQILSNKYQSNLLQGHSPDNAILLSAAGTDQYREAQLDTQQKLPILQMPSLAPIFHFPYIPFIQDQFYQPQANNTLVSQKPANQVLNMLLSPMPYGGGIAHQNLNFTKTPLDKLYPYLNQQNSEYLQGSTALFPQTMTQPMWNQACFYG